PAATLFATRLAARARPRNIAPRSFAVSVTRFSGSTWPLSGSKFGAPPGRGGPCRSDRPSCTGPGEERGPLLATSLPPFGEFFSGDCGSFGDGGDGARSGSRSGGSGSVS